MSKKKDKIQNSGEQDPRIKEILDKLPKEAQEKLEKIKKELDTFKDEVMKKFDNYVVGIALLPPPEMAGVAPAGPTMQQQQQPPQENQPNKDQINVLVLIDDSDSKTMAKAELKAKLEAIIHEIGQKINPNLVPQVLILTELWGNCLDQKYDILRLIAMSHTIYDKGTLAAIKIAEIHKTMVVKKFERYIVSYVLAGSIVQGRSTPESDIDVFIVIDDTDVKRMTRYELKEKLRAIIITMGIEAGEMTGIRNKLNIQVYILTDFWESVREANPIIFTFLRDGIPLHDTGIFLPWKQLLKMGKIRPSEEAIDLYMHSGEEILARVKKKINEIGMEDTYWAILTPSQAALMLYGIAPPTPRETPALMREIFVGKEKILEEKYVKILERNIEVRKDLEHGKIKDLAGKEADQLITDAEDYLKRIQELFNALRQRKERESVKKDYEDVSSMVREVLRLEGFEYAKDNEMVPKLKDLVDKGKLESKFHRMFKDLVDFYNNYEKGKLTKAEIATAKKDTAALVSRLNDYIQMIKGLSIEKCRIHVKHGSKFGEVLLLDDKAFIVFDLEAKTKEVAKAAIKDGRIINVKKSSIEEMDKAITEEKLPDRAFIKETLFEDLKKHFGKDVEILVRR